MRICLCDGTCAPWHWGWIMGCTHAHTTVATRVLRAVPWRRWRYGASAHHNGPVCPDNYNRTIGTHFSFSLSFFSNLSLSLSLSLLFVYSLKLAQGGTSKRSPLTRGSIILPFFALLWRCSQSVRAILCTRPILFVRVDVSGF